METVCIHHGNCADGYGAAWVVHHCFKQIAAPVEFHAGFYGKPPPDVKGKSVIIVDFSYKRDIMQKLLDDCVRMVILDHHKTAIEDLAGFGKGNDKFTSVFDLNRSGAGITWDYFFSKSPRRALINHIEDRDLWRFKLDGTKEIQAAVFSYPYDFTTWDLLMSLPVEKLRQEGEAIMRKHTKDINELLPIATRRMNIGGYNVPVANLPYIFSSEAGHILCKDEAFGACYMDGPEGRTFSLRSTDAGMDVSEIAKQFGGGGHRNAAGFKASFKQAQEFEV